MAHKPSSLEAAAMDELGGPGRVGALFGDGIEPKQLDLVRTKDEKLPSNVFRLQRQDPEAMAGPGRPLHSRNKRSKDLAKLLIHKYGSSVEFLASIKAIPLDQLCELLLIADGTIERREKLDEMLTNLGKQVRELANSAKDASNSDAIGRLADACEALELVTRRGAAKPGDVAIKALNLQIASARAAAEYEEQKMPVQVMAEHKTDGVLVMPNLASGAGAAQVDAATRAAADGLAKLLANGTIEESDIVGMRMVDGQLQRVEDAEFEEAPDDA